VGVLFGKKFKPQECCYCGTEGVVKKDIALLPEYHYATPVNHIALLINAITISFIKITYD
jgi:hypothetical protein